MIIRKLKHKQAISCSMSTENKLFLKKNLLTSLFKWTATQTHLKILIIGNSTQTHSHTLHGMIVQYYQWFWSVQIWWLKNKLESSIKDRQNSKVTAGCMSVLGESEKRWKEKCRTLKKLLRIWVPLIYWNRPGRRLYPVCLKARLREELLSRKEQYAGSIEYKQYFINRLGGYESAFNMYTSCGLTYWSFYFKEG